MTQPSCSPGAPPLLPSASSRSPQHPQVTVGPCQFHPQVQASSTPAPSASSRSPQPPQVTVGSCQFHPQVQASFLLCAGFLWLIPLCGFLASGLSRTETSLGSAFKSPEVDSSSETILSLCSSQGRHPHSYVADQGVQRSAHISDQCVQRSVHATTSSGTQVNLFCFT